MVQQHYTAPACFTNKDYDGPAKPQGGEREVWRMPKQNKDKLELCWGQLGTETEFGRGMKRKRDRNKVIKKEKERLKEMEDEKDRNQDGNTEDDECKEVEKKSKEIATKMILNNKRGKIIRKITRRTTGAKCVSNNQKKITSFFTSLGVRAMGGVGVEIQPNQAKTEGKWPTVNGGACMEGGEGLTALEKGWGCNRGLNLRIRLMVEGTIMAAGKLRVGQFNIILSVLVDLLYTDEGK